MLAIGLTLSMSGCGSGDSTESGSGGSAGAGSNAGPTKTSYPLTIENCGRKVTFEKAPERVLIMNGASVGEVQTYVLLGLQSHVLANAQRVSISDDPKMVAEVAKLPTGGTTWNKNFDVPAEKVLDLKPDLVVSTWSGGFNAESGFATRDQLTKAGINSYVNPVDCAYGAGNPSAADQAAYDQQSIASTFDFIEQTGVIFDEQKKAFDLVDKLKQRISAVNDRVKDKDRPKVLLAYPGMAMMSTNNLPAVFSGGVYDDIIEKAGGENAFPSDKPDPELTSNLNAEALASADVDVLVIGLSDPSEKAKVKQMADQLFKKYPQWKASKTKTYTTVSDGAFIGPSNVYAVEKIADAAHPQ
ncbi:ABC transporter substrate-binding protein [Streptomyces sp. ATCC 21386]|uniref:ABC transporter substrate-binding protein n=1 Tax=Streptomyces sp. ATCC 21386 TaxID=2699428 RepID=UPI001BFF6B80|nr:ABC transporter substrate-binding protein [Streptomyces sp. ATCC 21386]